MEKQAHIQLSEQAEITKAIVVGDPIRVDKVGEQLSEVTFLTQNREYRSLKGKIGDEWILVMSTGIGAPSAAIAMEELYNIGIRTVIRVGSCGAMQTGINLGELVISTGVIRDEGLTTRYVPKEFPGIPDSKLLQKAIELSPESHFGITRSHDGFYMPSNEADEAYWSDFGILGGDMETSTVYVLGTLKGMKTLSILNNVVLYQADLGDGVNDLVNGDSIVAKGEADSITLAINILKEEVA